MSWLRSSLIRTGHKCCGTRWSPCSNRTRTTWPEPSPPRYGADELRVRLADDRGGQDKRLLAWLRLEEADAVTGICFAVAVMWFILIATAATLGVHHQQIQMAQDAARAL